MENWRQNALHNMVDLCRRKAVLHIKANSPYGICVTLNLIISTHLPQNILWGDYDQRKQNKLQIIFNQVLIFLKHLGFQFQLSSL